MHNTELEYIHRLQEGLRSPFLDTFFIGWSFVDTFGFGILLIGIVWYLIQRSIGIKLFYILMISTVMNFFFKHLFDLPRPCQIDPSVAVFGCHPSPGFPSGAAQTAILIAGIIFLETKRPLYRLLGILFAFFLCLSRVYLGVHYFTDILGGLAIGALLLVVYQKLFPALKKHWKLLSLLFPVFIFLMTPYFKFQMWISLGISLGLILADKKQFQISPHFKIRFLQAVTAILGTYLIIQAAKANPWVLIPGLVLGGFWFSFLNSYLIKKWV